MSLDVKKDIIFNTFNGLEEQLSDPDPVKEVRNYRWALRQQTILFQKFLNEMRLEKEAIRQRLEEEFEGLNEKREEVLEQLKQDMKGLEKQLQSLEDTHREEIKYQSSLTSLKLKEQEIALRKELEPKLDEFANQIRDVVRAEELSKTEKHLRELFLLSHQRSVDLLELSNQLRDFATKLEESGNDFSTYLKNTGAKEFTVKVGTEYNPSRHEIVSTITDPSIPYNTIVEVRETGFAMKRRPLVRAQVVLNVSPKSVTSIKNEIRANESKVREEIKELINEYQEHGDVELVRRRQIDEREYSIGDEVEPISDDVDSTIDDVEYDDDQVETKDVEEPRKESWLERRRRLKREAIEAKEEEQDDSEEYDDEEYDDEEYDDEDLGDTDDLFEE